MAVFKDIIMLMDAWHQKLYSDCIHSDVHVHACSKLTGVASPNMHTCMYMYMYVAITVVNDQSYWLL